MCNYLGYDRLLSVLYIHRYSSLAVALHYSIFALSRRYHFATFGFYPSEFYSPLSLNHLVDFPLPRQFSAPTRSSYEQLLTYYRQAYF